MPCAILFRSYINSCGRFPLFSWHRCPVSFSQERSQWGSGSCVRSIVLQPHWDLSSIILQRHTIATKFSRCIAVPVIPLPVEAGVYLIKCLKPGGTPAAHMAHHELFAKMGSLPLPLPPAAPCTC